MEPEKKMSWKDVLIKKIFNKAHAEYVLGQVVKGVYAIAAIQILVAILIVFLEGELYMAVGAVADGLIYALLAFLAQRFKSRVAAVILLVVAVIAVIGSAVGANIILALLLLWFSIRITQAAFAIHKLTPAVKPPMNPDSAPKV